MGKRVLRKAEMDEDRTVCLKRPKSTWGTDASGSAVRTVLSKHRFAIAVALDENLGEFGKRGNEERFSAVRFFDRIVMNAVERGCHMLPKLDAISMRRATLEFLAATPLFASSLEQGDVDQQRWFGDCENPLGALIDSFALVEDTDIVDGAHTFVISSVHLAHLVRERMTKVYQSGCMVSLETTSADWSKIEQENNLAAWLKKEPL